MRPRESAMSPGVNLIGFVGSALGLGEAARQTARLAVKSGVPLACADIELPGVSREQFDCTRVDSLSALPYSVNVYHVNPPELFGLLLRWRRRTGFDIKQNMNVMVPFWELPDLPALWRDVLSSMDVILAPTKFIAETIEQSLEPEERPIILHYPQAVCPPDAVTRDRRRWLGERAEGFAVLFSFDAGSEIERKNPAAVVRAFQKAFPADDDVTLLLKVSRSQYAVGQQWDVVAAAMEVDHRIRVITEHLSREDLWSLFASVDAYLSLHRSEGLGLGMMECMSVGTPVIATAWSGNMDFTTHENSLLVPYELTDVADISNANYVGLAHLKWAAPDVEEAARLLSMLRESPELRATLGEAGRETIAAIWDSARGQTLMDLTRMADDVVRSPEHARRSRRALRSMWKSYPQYSYANSAVDSVKIAIVKALRRLGLKEPGPEAKPPSLHE